ncbi:spindle checkpoint protein bubr1, putative [Ixodes scapularis]|uniref:Spindle checkpoint protein bubr1, putative n=1 Tax=Ixodes scapularis TaxID=6945 RepID=B7P2J7_IXOSC|nr:spindle checkpoint protein bubr1, putative [Ixodes scapularis]|eukprot:XP_002402457.1 spindle checkpoint protein bubr1, putative [Ixodes scapularis]
MAEGGEDWELCKENIQPLKQGRAMSSLQAALQGKDTVHKRRRNFEEELRTYSGEDPLDVWHRWADISSEPEVVFKAMYDRGVGAGLAPFYVRWANHREAVGDSKNAAKILRKGITRKAYPKETLEAQLRHLEARVSRQVAQQMMEVGEEAATTEDNRSVLATLKQVGRRGQVGTERALQRVEVQGGVGGKALGHAGNRAPRVLSRENPEGDDDVFVRPAAPAPFVVAAEGAKENASRPGKWTSAKMLAKEKEQERLEREAAKDREVQALRLQVEQMRNELAEMRRLSAPVQEQQVMKEQINLLEQSILITNRSLRVSALPPALQPSVHGAAAVPVQNGSQSSSPGNTTTTDVSCMVRGLWNGTLAQSGLEEKSPAANCSTDGRVAHPTTAAAPFEVFSEPTQTRPPSVPCGPADPTDVAGTCLVADENGRPSARLRPAVCEECL